MPEAKIQEESPALSGSSKLTHPSEPPDVVFVVESNLKSMKSCPASLTKQAASLATLPFESS